MDRPSGTWRVWLLFQFLGVAFTPGQQPRSLATSAQTSVPSQRPKFVLAWVVSLVTVQRRCLFANLVETGGPVLTP